MVTSILRPSVYGPVRAHWETSPAAVYHHRLGNARACSSHHVRDADREVFFFLSFTAVHGWGNNKEWIDHGFFEECDAAMRILDGSRAVVSWFWAVGQRDGLGCLMMVDRFVVVRSGFCFCRHVQMGDFSFTFLPGLLIAN
ncbi:hypothetical protein HPP92_020574 [Vanilla planifolia]|uniref:Uncharacterized protein n=1 Tax=Vanilla planifolia TaxID=51239 RepID=A0A835UI00_VANPL|nr:hypothetical protein HPP92_020574 [Vanilla planifolia]